MRGIIILLFICGIKISQAAVPCYSGNSIINYADTLSLDTLKFSFGCGLNSCPTYDLIITKNHASYSTEHKGLTNKYNCTITAVTYDSLMYYIHYAAIDSFEKNHDYIMDDGYERNLEIKFSDGEIKKLEDDTISCKIYGLKRLYHFLFSLKRTQHWQKVK